MNSAQEKIVNNALDKIAKSEGITTEEVKEEIALAIACALKSDDPKVQSFWKNIPCNGEAPTVEEVIRHIAMQLASDNK